MNLKENLRALIVDSVFSFYRFFRAVNTDRHSPTLKKRIPKIRDDETVRLQQKKKKKNPLEKKKSCQAQLLWHLQIMKKFEENHEYFC